MITSYEVRELPRARDFQEAEDRLHEMVEIGLPVFAMDCAGYGYEATRNTLNEVMPRAGFSLSGGVTRLCRPTITGDQSVGDLPLHMDSFPGIETNSLADIINTHYTLFGRTKDSFFVPHPDFLSSDGDLPLRAHELFVDGSVDDDILRPICFQGEVSEDGLVVFRLSGKLPVAHHFETLETPRYSNIEFANYVGKASIETA